MTTLGIPKQYSDETRVFLAVKQCQNLTGKPAGVTDIHNATGIPFADIKRYLKKPDGFFEQSEYDKYKTTRWRIRTQ